MASKPPNTKQPATAVAAAGSGATAPATATTALARKPSAMRRLLSKNLVVFGLIVFLLATGAALFAPLIATHEPRGMDVIARLQAPSAEHLFGTDHLGRDVFSRVIYGARVSLFVGFASVLVSTVAGVILGALSGYIPAVDSVLMRIMDGLMAFPVILLAIALMAALGPSIWNVIMALSFVYTPRTARIVRSAILSIKPAPYVEAAGALGVRHMTILSKHILPNCVSPIIVQSTFVFAYSVQAEAALSFLGVGVPPDVPTWGIMLNEARLYMTNAPWIMIPPGIAIALVVLALNALGDALRDFLDPHLRNL